MSLLNNAEYFVAKRYAAIRQETHDFVWQPGFYAGTVGSATTAQVKSYLQAAGYTES